VKEEHSRVSVGAGVTEALGDDSDRLYFVWLESRKSDLTSKTSSLIVKCMSSRLHHTERGERSQLAQIWHVCCRPSFRRDEDAGSQQLIL